MQGLEEEVVEEEETEVDNWNNPLTGSQTGSSSILFEPLAISISSSVISIIISSIRSIWLTLDSL